MSDKYQRPKDIDDAVNKLHKKYNLEYKKPDKANDAPKQIRSKKPTDLFKAAESYAKNVKPNVKPKAIARIGGARALGLIGDAAFPNEVNAFDDKNAIKKWRKNKGLPE